MAGIFLMMRFSYFIVSLVVKEQHIEILLQFKMCLLVIKKAGKFTKCQLKKYKLIKRVYSSK